MLVILLALGVAVAGGDATKGEAIYTANCMACHGQKADGKGPAAAALKPRPTDFTKADWWSGHDDGAIKALIKSGKPGTSMMGFPQLNDKQLDDLVAWMRSKAP